MNYELAKELKDAGFPQDIRDVNSELDGWWAPDGDIIAPTLSELIEVCGGEFVALVRWDDDLWVASNCERDTPMVHTGRAIHGQGKTPEEAVAKLWIALNKK